MIESIFSEVIALRSTGWDEALSVDLPGKPEFKAFVLPKWVNPLNEEIVHICPMNGFFQKHLKLVPDGRENTLTKGYSAFCSDCNTTYYNEI